MAGLDPTRTPERQTIEEQIRRALQGLRYGAVELVVHDGRVIQIERRERVRFEPDPTARREGNVTDSRSVRICSVQP